MATVPPTRTAGQRRAAARVAIESRRMRSDIKQEVRQGYLSCSQVVDLAFEDSVVGRAVARMTVGELLLSVPGVGPARADRALVALGIRGDRRLRALGPRQRAGLREVFW